MTKAKLDELIADLGYALMYLKQARAEHKGGDFQLNRTRELVAKVGDALIAERKRAPGKPASRAWTDRRRELVIADARQRPYFSEVIGLDSTDLSTLYDIVVSEAENWDGEEVAVNHIVNLMIARHKAVGLAPSRN